MQDTNPNFIAAAQRVFGSWKMAIEASGIAYESISSRAPTQKWTKKKVISEIRHRRGKGLALNMVQVKAEDSRLYAVAVRLFGNWGNAVTAADLDYDDVRVDRVWHTKECVTQEVLRLRDLGEDLSLSAFKSSHPGHYVAACRHFGSWKKMFEAMGLSYARVRKNTRWSPERVIAEIQERHKNGLPLNAKYLSLNCPILINRGIFIFGSWEEAITASGLSYDDIILRWMANRRIKHLKRVNLLKDNDT